MAAEARVAREAVPAAGNAAVAPPEPVPALLAALDRARAADLARAGDLDGAAQVLTTGAAGREPSAADLDLLARIRAQQGDYPAAERCWSDAARRADDAAAFGAQRRRLAQVRDRPPRTRRRGVLLAAALLAVLAAGVVGYGVGGAVARRPDPAVADLQRRQEALGADVRALADADRADRADWADRAAPAGPDLDDVAARLTAAGTTVGRSGPDLLVVFPDGLFDGGTRLTAAGDAALTRVGAALADRAGGLHVVVVGQTDDFGRSAGGRYGDNTELALARALAAARTLAPAAHLPLPAVGLAAGGAGDAPFPNTAEATRARNRTVTLEVSADPVAR